ncbi:hypothetical protein ABEG17_10415 [Pedococcus sp. KACC 23699]|uniref:DUF1049 domain-containing protein n=1 Tax=Pedococcus sp. KACC 23699 TaxID=3149228 RepID=A0AAU7JP85_9MICO
MIVLGLILVIVAIAAGVLLFLGTQSLTNTVNLDAAGIKVGLTPLALLIAGALIVLLLWFGLGIIRGVMKRRRRPARDAKEAQRQAELEESVRADERKRAEETHQSALADRDRAKDAELESKLAERDRVRNDEFRAREREIEDRARADERARVERELSARQTTVAAVPATAAGATHGGAATHGEATTHGEAYDRTGDSEAHERTGDGAADERLYSPADTDAATGVDHQTHDQADATTVGADRPGYDEADAATAAGERPAHRTMADRIMGRDPQGRD